MKQIKRMMLTSIKIFHFSSSVLPRLLEKFMVYKYNLL